MKTNCCLLLVLVFLQIIQQEVLMECHPSGVTRTRIRVIGVNFSELLIKGKGNFVRVRVNRVKLTKKWGQIQGKWDIIRVSREFELSEFELSKF